MSDEQLEAQVKEFHEAALDELFNRVKDASNVSYVVVIEKTTGQAHALSTANAPKEALMLVEVLSANIAKLFIKPINDELDAAAQLRRIIQPQGMDILRQRHLGNLAQKHAVQKPDLWQPGSMGLLDAYGNPIRN